MEKILYICTRKPMVRFTERKRVFSLSVSVKLGHFHDAIKSDNGGRMLTCSVLSFLLTYTKWSLFKTPCLLNCKTGSPSPHTEDREVMDGSTFFVVCNSLRAEEGRLPKIP